jgi:hypothetical protein
MIGEDECRSGSPSSDSRGWRLDSGLGKKRMEAIWDSTWRRDGLRLRSQGESPGWE